jgi:hypothetical protein
MQPKEKIGIAIVIILTIILAINIWAEQKVVNLKAKINCDEMCIQKGNDTWSLSGPDYTNDFSTQKDCISACQAIFKQ